MMRSDRRRADSNPGKEETKPLSRAVGGTLSRSTAVSGVRTSPRTVRAGDETVAGDLTASSDAPIG